MNLPLLECSITFDKNTFSTNENNIQTVEKTTAVQKMLYVEKNAHTVKMKKNLESEYL